MAWERERWFPEVLRGVLVGNATVERHTADIFGFETTVTRRGDHHVLRGTKYYSTGSLYCDRVAVAAKAEDGRTVSGSAAASRPSTKWKCARSAWATAGSAAAS